MTTVHTILALLIVDVAFRNRFVSDPGEALVFYRLPPPAFGDLEKLVALSRAMRDDGGIAEKFEAVHRALCPFWPCGRGLSISGEEVGEQA